MYLQSFRKLDACSAEMVQPQKRRDIKSAMEACMGRMLEVRNWMVSCSVGLAVTDSADVTDTVTHADNMVMFHSSGIPESGH